MARQVPSGMRGSSNEFAFVLIASCRRRVMNEVLNYSQQY